MTKLPLAAGFALALAGSAFAADLPSYKAPPPPPPPPPFTWTGLYGGVNVGYGFNAGGSTVGSQIFRNGTAVPTAFQIGGPSWWLDNNIHGVTGGGQAGYNYQFNPWFVVGAEFDIQASDIHGNVSGVSGFPAAGGFNPYVGTINSAQHVDWWGTVRGRLGVTLPSWSNLMVYGTGGFAYGAVNNTYGYGAFVPPIGTPGAAVANGVYDNTKTGWTAGGGVEWTPLSFPSWSLKAEYLYVDLGSSTVAALGVGVPTGFVAAAANRTQTRFQVVRAGVNWHFNPFATAPVLAKY
ncbi:outer membrane beta-barrel protein [Methylocystis sp. 9N]|uniref:Outer membrane beta-barrel protein n=1 Tax=Methylocystis borbori TaxID=3118750 RepID=A0ABU7XHJ7_9HYPH